MKMFINAAMIIALVLISSCNGSENNEAWEFVSGTYVRFSEHEYGKEYDTLVVTKMGSNVHLFKAVRKFQYNRVLDGRPMDPDYKQTTTTLVYDPSTQLFNESETGLVYSVDREKNILLAGTNEYKKL